MSEVTQVIISVYSRGDDESEDAIIGLIQNWFIEHHGFACFHMLPGIEGDAGGNKSFYDHLLIGAYRDFDFKPLLYWLVAQSFFDPFREYNQVEVIMKTASNKAPVWRVIT